MKKIIIGCCLFGIIIGVGYLGYHAIQKHKVLSATEEKIKVLPDFWFYDTNEAVFKSTSEPGLQTLIVYFHPECEHCQYEAKQLLKHREQFMNTQVLMISPAPLAQIVQFSIDYQLVNIPTLKVLWDKEGTFQSYFGSSSFPTVLIYNSKSELQKKYKGEVKIEAILKHLEKTAKKSIGDVSSRSPSTFHFVDLNIVEGLFDLGL